MFSFLQPEVVNTFIVGVFVGMGIAFLVDFIVDKNIRRS